jgi:hypothetical protein
MLVAAVAPASVWRCLDGTPCPMGGAMPHAAKAKPPAATHSCCQPKVVAVSTRSDSASSGMQCVLTHSDSPAAALVSAQTVSCVPDFTLALPSSAPVVIRPLQAAEWVILSSDLPPPEFQSARFGRSPPASAS